MYPLPTFPQHPAFRGGSSRHAQRGISVIEVLISIFILAVGLLSIAALLPLGQNDVAQADQDERKANLALNASRTFRTRGFADYRLWCQASGTSLYDESNATTNIPAILTQPIFIDPILLGLDNAARPAGVDMVPHQGGPSFPRPSVQFPRISVRTSTRLDSNNQKSVGLANNLGAVAPIEAIFTLQDETLTDTPFSTDGPPRNRFDTTNNISPNTPVPPASIIRRSFEGNYTWMAMLQPIPNTGVGDAYPSRSMLPRSQSSIARGIPYGGMPVQLSIVVFYKRPSAVLLDSDNRDGNDKGIPREREVDVTIVPGAGIGGGEATISVSDAALKNWLLVKLGEWALLHYQVNNGPRRYQWVKILSASNIDPNTRSRQITLAGPDLMIPGNGGVSGKLVIFDDAVMVHTKTIHLEGPNLWN
ncbi:MAG: prepilin-type N-terminal cleavage/methylation domain-containing protein [Pirellulales bacterium]|nr:prepilin-type N-terminal cleavage/methylation domain-containing protein [Pirellulales bacterium]